MKKPSGTRVNIMIMGIVVVVLALGLAAILGYGKARKQMEQMQQAQQEQEAKEAQITPTQTVTPEPTDDPTDPAVQKKNLITEIKKAVEHNDVKIMTADLRYTSQEGQVEAYTQEDVAAVLLHLKKNEKDYQAFVEKLRIHANGSDNTSVAGALTMAPSMANPYLSQEMIAECQKLSQCIITAFCASTGANNQGVYQTDEMSGLNWCSIPATIVEMGYMTNQEEDTRMQTAEYQQQMVTGIADGIDQ